MTETTDRGSLRAVVDRPDDLLDRADRAPDPTEFVVTPERLHRRNLKRRLAERATPRSSLWLTDATAIAARLLEADDAPSETIDRIDRLKHLEALLARDTEANERLRAAVGSDLTARVETIAAAHDRVAEMTAWDEQRLNALSAVADELPAVAARDTTDLLAGARALEQGLADRAGPVHSRETLLPAAADALRERPDLWTEAFPTAERLSVAGVSAVDAPLLSLLEAAANVGIDVTLSLRPGTGPAIVDRLPDRLGGSASLSVDDRGPSVAPAFAATELVGDTPEAEARLVAAVVTAHRRNGVSPSDVLVVARDAAEYERPLRRAMERQGVKLAVWAQLPVERTIPYRQFAATCAVLAADELELEPLLEPLEFHWVPPALAEADTDATAWPLSTDRIGDLRTALAEDPAVEHSLEGWAEQLSATADAGEIDQDRARSLRTYLDWAREQPGTPDPAAIHGTFEPLVTAGRNVALPAVFADDDADLGRTSRYARALSRIEELLTDTRAKYREWLDTGDVPRSWLAVADLAERVVTTRPGRREHANAAAVDVIDATDAWLREAPHVVAVGLVDGVWPRRAESVFPEALRQSVVAGDSAAARRLAVPGRWTAAREADHLASGLGAATETLCCTRYRRDREGTARERSPLLADVPTQHVDDEAVQSLLTAGTLPDALAADGGGSR